MVKRINLLKLNNTFDKGYGISRNDFICLEVNIPTTGDWFKDVLEKASRIEKNLNAGQANTSQTREAAVINIDNTSGIIAEYACDTILQYYLGKDNVSKPSSASSKNQIDIQLSGLKKTIEVRSSCVKNGVNFAVFAKPKNSVTQQYFDIIGPYSNGYKSGEELRDYYMRVFFACDKMNFPELINEEYLRLYITGGATKEMMCDPSLFQIKHLLPAGGGVQVESDYRVIPMGRSLDFIQFINTIKSDININGGQIEWLIEENQ